MFRTLIEFQLKQLCDSLHFTTCNLPQKNNLVWEYLFISMGEIQLPPINVAQFFNNFNNYCLPTFTSLTNYLTAFDFLLELNLTLPILLFMVNQTSPPPAQSIIPLLFKHLPHQNIGVCIHQYIFGLTIHLKDLRYILFLWGTAFEDLPTSHKFLIVAIPPNQFRDFSSLMHTSVFDVSLKIFLIQESTAEGENLNVCEIHYFCMRCPRDHHLVWKTPLSQNQHDLLTQLVKMEQIVTLNCAYSYELDLFFRDPYDLNTIHVNSMEASGPKMVSYLKETEGLNRFDYSYFAKVTIALKTFTFPQLLDFLLLENAMQPKLNSSPSRVSFSISLPPLNSITLFMSKRNQFVILTSDNQYNFLTCDSVHSSVNYNIYLSPADRYCWILTVVALLVITTILTFPLRGRYLAYFEMLIQMAGALLETPMTVDQRLSRGKLLLLSLWIGSSMILTTGWEATFTMEIITPIPNTSPFTSFLDLVNFTFFSPVAEDQYEFYDDSMRASPISELIMVFMNLKNSNRKGMSELARVALTFNPSDGYSHIQPLAYHHPDDFSGNLTLPSCKGKAYVDTKERIDAILPYANQVGSMSGIRFVKGKQVLQTNPNGFMWTVSGDSRLAGRLVQRLQNLIGSGIYKYWEELYSRFRPIKLFEYYDERVNRDGFMNNGMKQLDLNSKLVSILVMFGILCGSCCVVLVVEVCSCFIVLHKEKGNRIFRYYII